MDISYWTQSNPKIKIDHTTKKYFNQYLYKLVVYAPGGRLIDAKGDLATALEHRRHLTKNINVGYWGYRASKELENADVDFLSIMRDIRRDRGIGVKLRVEEPRIQIYAENEQTLIDLVKQHFTGYLDYLELVTAPADAEAEAVLNLGAIIRRTDVGYTYKVILRDGRYDTQTKLNLLAYLENCGWETVGIPNSCRDMLGKPSSYIWNCYFHTNDLSILTFINLINPSIVSNHHELVVLTNK